MNFISFKKSLLALSGLSVMLLAFEVQANKEKLAYKENIAQLGKKRGNLGGPEGEPESKRVRR